MADDELKALYPFLHGGSKEAASEHAALLESVGVQTAFITIP